MKVLNFDGDDDDDDVERKKKLSLSQTIDRVMTIKTHTESSKTELSSKGKRPFKVWFKNLTFLCPSFRRGLFLDDLDVEGISIKRSRL